MEKERLCSEWLTFIVVVKELVPWDTAALFSDQELDEELVVSGL